MNKQQNSDIRQVLNEPAIGQPRPMNQLVDGALLTLEITQVQPYDRNPRKGRNPKYHDIKASIQARGIEHPVKVTQRPGMQPDQFMISGGGNTRLAILHELYEETGDCRFQSHRFIYETWTSESSNVIAHLIENNERGEMTLIDKARAIFDAKSLLEDETGDRYTNRRLVEVLKKAGLSSVDRRRINTYEFALETLYQVIPDLLDQGLARPQINRINKLLKAAQRLWLHHNPDEEDFRILFLQLLARQNHADPSDGWQEQFQVDVIRELAQGDRNDFEKTRIQLEHLLSHGELLLVDEAATASLIPPATNSKDESPVNSKLAPEPSSEKSAQQLEKDSAYSLHVATDSEPPEENLSDEGLSAIRAQQQEEKPRFNVETNQADTVAQGTTLESLRSVSEMRTTIFNSAFEMAELAFAESDDAQCLVSIDNGAGFFIQEFPALAQTIEKPNYPDIKITQSTHNEHLRIRAANCLEFLFNLSEQFSPPATAVIEHIDLYPENSLLATYHLATIPGWQEPAESESSVLRTWRHLFESRRHNALSFSYYNMTRGESERVTQLMKQLLAAYHELTVTHCVQRMCIPLWTMEEQS